MPDYTSTQIANEFLRLPGAAQRLTQMQLQKLAYIANGWNLAINGEPLIAEDPQAWSLGPVYRNLYEHTQTFGSAPIGRQLTPKDHRIIANYYESEGNDLSAPYAAALSESEKQIIENVWARYGSMSGSRLSSMTHEPNTPWYKAFRRGKNTPLRKDEIMEHYLELAKRATHVA